MRKEIAGATEAKHLRIMAFKTDDKDQEAEKLCKEANVTFILKPEGNEDAFIDKMTAAKSAKN